MKIRTKITAGARFVVAFVVVGSSLLSGYAGLVTSKVSADPAPPTPTASGAIVPDQYNATSGVDEKNNSGYQCTAYISAPADYGNGTVPTGSLAVAAAELGYQTSIGEINALLGAVQGASSDAQSTFNDVIQDKGVLAVRFKGVNNNTDNNNMCDMSMYLFRKASTSGGTADTTFYGYWDTGEFAQPGANLQRTLVAMEAAVSPGEKNIEFTIPSGYSRSGTFLMNLADPNGVLKNTAYFPPSGGGGSTTGGANCFEHNAGTNADLANCIKAASPASFNDAAEIVYAGDTYTATGWGNVSNQIVYKLTTPGDPGRLPGGLPTPQIVMDTTKANLDINMDNKGDINQINQIARTLKNAVQGGSTVSLELDNVDVSGAQTKGTITALPAGMATFAAYYPSTDQVALVFAAAGTNEQPYFGTYSRVTGTNNFALAGSNWGGKCNNLATFTFKTDPKTAATTSYQGSTLTTVSSIGASWDLNANDGPCTVGNVPVNVLLNAGSNATPPGSGGGTASDTGGSPTINCSVTLFNPLSWLFCPLASAFELVVTSLDNEINNFMNIQPGKGSYTAGATCGNDQWCSYYQSWIVVRNISLGLIAVFALVAVVSQAFGLEVFDAYTIRKILPRLLIAAIGITLSWPLMMFFIKFTDDLGFGIRQLIYAPFSGLKVQLGGGAQFIASFFVVGGAIMLLGFAGLLSFVATAALAVSIAFLVLVLRQMVIALLVIFAPIALACYVMPGTQKVWKLWWDSFSRGLLMFPIIAGLIAIGRVFAAVNSHGAGSLNQIISFVAYFAPYFMIPLTFKLAGGAVSTLGGLVNDRSRGAFDRLSKFRKGQTDKRTAHYADKFGSRALQAKASAVRGLNSYASTDANGRLARGAARFASRRIEGIDNLEARMSALNATRGKQLGDQIATGNDGEIRGLTVNKRAADAAYARGDHSLRRVNDGRTEYLSLGGAWVGETDVLNAQRRWGKDVAAQQAATSYEMRKAMSEDQVQGVANRYGALATQQWGMTETQAGGSWIGAAFENQNQHLEYKSTNWKDGTLNGSKFSQEVYEKKGTYPLSQMSSHTITQLKNAYKTAGETGDAATQQRIQAIAESFVQRGGGGMGGQVGEVDGQPVTAPANLANQTPEQQRQYRDFVQTNSQGSAHVAENVRDLAAYVGVYGPPGPAGAPNRSGETVNNPAQR